MSDVNYTQNKTPKNIRIKNVSNITIDKNIKQDQHPHTIVKWKSSMQLQIASQFHLAISPEK